MPEDKNKKKIIKDLVPRNDKGPFLDIQAPLTEDYSIDRYLGIVEPVKYKDYRKVRATTKKSLKSTHQKNLNLDPEFIKTVVGYAKANGVDPERALATAIVESQGNPSYSNPFHLLNRKPEDWNKFSSPIEQGIKMIKEKNEYAKRLGLNKTKELEAQVFNGTRLMPYTEGYGTNFYGVKIPKEGMDMKKNPLYGIEVYDHVNNLQKNTDIMKLIKNTPAKKTTTSKQGPLKNRVYDEWSPDNQIFKHGGKVKFTDVANKYFNAYSEGLNEDDLVPMFQKEYGLDKETALQYARNIHQNPLARRDTEFLQNQPLQKTYNPSYPPSQGKYKLNTNLTPKQPITPDEYKHGGIAKMDFGGETQFDFNNQDLINSRMESSKAYAIESEKRRIHDRDTGGSLFQRGLRGAKDMGVYTADMALSPINQDIIKDKHYSSSGFGKINKEASHIGGPIINKAAPIVANYFAPGTGQLVTAGQQASNSFVKQDEDRMDTGTGKVMNALDPFLGAASSAIGSSMGSPGSTGTTGLENIPTGKMGGYAMKRYEDGGMPTALINIEGSGRAEGSPIQMRKGELLVSNGKILDNYIKNPRHPKNPNEINPIGTKTVTPTATGENPKIIPMSNSVEYSTTNIAERKRIELSIVSKEMERNRKENVSKIMDFKKKYGGKVIPRFDPGGDPFDAGNIVPGTQPDMTSWLGNLGNYGTQINTTPDSSMITSDSMQGNYQDNLTASPNKMPNDFSKYANIGSKALSLLSPLMKIKDGMGKPDVLKRSDYTVAPNLKPSLIDDYATQQMINDAANVGLYSLRRSNRGPAAQINLGVNAMKQKWASKQEIQKANAASIMDTNKANKQIEQGNMQGYFEVENRNAANAAAGRNLRREGVNDLSKAANQDIYDKSFWDTIPMVADNPKFNAWLKARQSNNKTNK